MPFPTITFDCSSDFHDGERRVEQSASLSGGKVPDVCYSCAHPEATRRQHPLTWEALGDDALVIFRTYAYQTGGWVMWLYIPDGTGGAHVVGDAGDSSGGFWVGYDHDTDDGTLAETEPALILPPHRPGFVGIVRALHAAHVARTPADADPLPQS